VALLCCFAVQKISGLYRSTARRLMFVAGALVFAAMPARSALGAEVAAQTLRNVAGIVAHEGGRQVQIGTAFFVAVPSQAVPGQSFVYLITTHHNLLDESGHARSGLMLSVEDRRTGAMREEALPPENKWVLDPENSKTDVAAVPFSPAEASIAPIALSSVLGSDDPYSRPETGAQIYYLTAATVGIVNKRFEALARFGHVSVPIPAETEVVGAGVQDLALLDGGTAPGYSSGAPVFVSIGLRFALWGMLEANSAASSNPLFSGLAGVLPAKYVSDTVKAMASIQDKALRASGAH
jgi:hypothetical protein